MTVKEKMSSSYQRSSLNLSVLQYYVIAGLTCIFVWSLFAESVAQHYLPLLYAPGATLITRALFWSTMLLFIFVRVARRQVFPRVIYIYCLIALSFTFFGVIVGVSNGNSLAGIISHTSHYIGALVCVLSSSMVKFGDDERFWKIAKWLSFIVLLFAAPFFWITFSSINSILHVSLSISALAWPFMFGMIKKSPIFLFFAVLLILSSLKRGLWLAAFAVTLFSASTRVKFLMMGLAATVFLVFFTLFRNTTLADLLVYKMEIGRGAGIDALLSGRISVFYSLNEALSQNHHVLTGLGFGAVFNANLLSTVADSDWVTNGVDVVFGHFWFLHGYFWGTVAFLMYSIAYLSPVLWNRRHKDKILEFFSGMLVFFYVASFSTFIVWDPLPWVILGLSIARRQHLQKIREPHLLSFSSLRSRAF